MNINLNQTFLCACLEAFLKEELVRFSARMSPASLSLRDEPPSFAMLPTNPPRFDLRPYAAIGILLGYWWGRPARRPPPRSDPARGAPYDTRFRARVRLF